MYKGSSGHILEGSLNGVNVGLGISHNQTWELLLGHLQYLGSEYSAFYSASHSSPHCIFINCNYFLVMEV